MEEARGSAPLPKALSCLLLAAAVSPLPAAQGWLRLVSPPFELYTDAGEGAGGSALSGLQAIRQVFREAAPQAAELPVRVYLFSSERDFRRYRPAETTQGFYQGGPELDCIAAVRDVADVQRLLFHEYAHLVLNRWLARLPRWLEEGTAEFYSTLERKAGRLVVGRVIPSHLALLSRSRWLDASTLAAVDRRSTHYHDRSHVGLFYAQSWALTHMLNMAPGWRENLASFALLLSDGEPPESAFSKAFGKPLEAALGELRVYLEGRRFPVLDLAAAGAAPSPVSRPEPLSPRQSRLALAELAHHVGRHAEAAQAYRELAGETPDSPEIQTALGALALRLRRFDEARGHLERAIQLGSRQASTFFEYAMLLRDQNGARGEIAGLLARTVELNPNYAEARFILGVMADADGRPAEAVEHLRQAVAVLPRQPTLWHALAMAHHHMGNAQQALVAARRALANAETPRDIEMARAAIQLVSIRRAPAPPGKPAVTTPQTWQPVAGSRRIEGSLEHIDCLGKQARFHIQAANRRWALLVADPGQVLLKNLSSVTFQFACGPQKPRGVTVEFQERPNADGEITSIEFHQDPLE